MAEKQTKPTRASSATKQGAGDNIRWPAERREELKQMADAAGLNFSEFIRQAVDRGTDGDVINWSPEERDALAKLAAIEGVSFVEFVMQATRIGIAAGAYVQEEKADTERQLVSRVEHRSNAVMLTQCLLMLRDMYSAAGEKAAKTKQKVADIVRAFVASAPDAVGGEKVIADVSRVLDDFAGKTEPVSVVRERATAVVDDLYADGDALEQALLDIEKDRIANLLGDDAADDGQGSADELGMVRPVAVEA